MDWASKLGHEGARQRYDKQEPQQVASLDAVADSREIGSTGKGRVPPAVIPKDRFRKWQVLESATLPGSEFISWPFSSEKAVMTNPQAPEEAIEAGRPAYHQD